MPFKQVFERRVNDDMQTGEAGPAPRSPAASRPTSIDDGDIKKQPCSPKAKSIYEAEDLDLYSKGEKELPPRFSTLFDTGKPAPLPPPTPRLVECCHRETRKKSGVYLSTPVFILLAVVLLFESTLLFAYTVIGLYQNLPSGLMAVVGGPPPMESCHCETTERQGSTINFAPNFVFGQGASSILDHESVIESLTTAQVSSATSSTTSTSTTSSTTSSATSSTSLTGSNSAAAAAASAVLNIFGDGEESSIKTSKTTVVTQTPGLVKSTILVTASAPTTDTSTAPPTTITSVEVVDGPTTTIQARQAPSVKQKQ